MVEAKIQHLPVPQDEPAGRSAKVVNLMDALRKSVQSDKAPAPGRKSVQKAVGATSSGGIALVKAGKGAKRKSA
jgi:non-homologous end joining protein Ku